MSEELARGTMAKVMWTNDELVGMVTRNVAAALELSALDVDSDVSASVLYQLDECNGVLCALYVAQGGSEEIVEQITSRMREVF